MQSGQNQANIRLKSTQKLDDLRDKGLRLLIATVDTSVTAPLLSDFSR